MSCAHSSFCAACHSKMESTTHSQGSPCLETWLLDLSYHVVDFLELKDLPCLFAVSREIHGLLYQGATFEIFARRKFPVETLQLSSYGGSWKRLLQDDNSENGVYLRRMFVLSEWRYNRKYQDLHYINAIRCMVWDRREQRVHIGIEAFGNRDLRPASRTSIFQLRIQPRRLGQRPATNSSSSRRRPPSLPELERRLTVSSVHAQEVFHPIRSSHDLCLLSMEDHWFEAPGCEYRFIYNGSLDSSGSDYECKNFLQNCSSLRECFELGPSSKVEGVNHCEFVSRDAPLLAPSDVNEWPSLMCPPEDEKAALQYFMDWLLPSSIRSLHARGQWGAVPSNSSKTSDLPLTANNLPSLVRAQAGAWYGWWCGWPNPEPFRRILRIFDTAR